MDETKIQVLIAAFTLLVAAIYALVRVCRWHIGRAPKPNMAIVFTFFVTSAAFMAILSVYTLLK